ncbi:MAG: phage tail sheath family protein [Deltaproteobacteria bacterium]|nr:phage tail sheath family protein [Deltaproteobacteria bacterium]
MASSVSNIRPPGIYDEMAERRHTPITLGKSGVPGFVGLAQRGPTNTPVRITGIPQFLDVFGDLPQGGFLAPAVEAFFHNGGRECFVVRVAHRTGMGGGDLAAPARLQLDDREGRPAIRVEASSEGVWGNQIVVSARVQAPRAQTFLTLDAQKGECEATVRSTHGFRPGTLVRIHNDGAEEHRYISGVYGKTIQWDVDEPLPEGMAASAPTYVEPVEFQLSVRSPLANETFSDLSLNPASPFFAERVVAERSRLVRLFLLASRSSPPMNLPADVQDVPMSGGHDGLEGLTPDDFIGMSGGPDNRTGLFALEVVDDIDLLAIPDVMWLFRRNAGLKVGPFSTLKDVEVVHDAMVSQCERLSDRFAVLDSPFPDDAGRTREYRLAFDTRFAALYFPWIVMDRGGRQITVPPSGHVAGVVARCDEEMGVHKPPANEVVRDAEDLAVLLREEDIGYLNSEGINCIRTFSTRGLRVWGARVMSSDPQFRYVNVRRILNSINRAMNTNLQWVVFEPNLPSLWKTVTRNVTHFLLDLWRKGYFTGSTPEEAFFVKCDDETNPPEEREAGRMIVEVGVAPVRPTEFVVLRVAQEMQGASEGD